MKLSTSTRISLWFAGMTIVILSIFAMVILQVFARSWKRGEDTRLRTPEQRLQIKKPLKQRIGKKNLPEPRVEKEVLTKRFSSTIFIEPSDPLYSHFPKYAQDERISKLEHTAGIWYMYRHRGDILVISNVTRSIEKQQKLFYLMLWGICIATIASFLLGRLFVGWALRDLHYLAKKVEQIDIDTLTFEHDLEHLPVHDEIRRVADALSSMSSNMHQQVTDMKQFVSNVSHELRTPLMILRSTNELALKSKQYTAALTKNMTTIGDMENLISTLLLLARPQQQALQKAFLSVDVITGEVLERVASLYSEKHISVVTTFADTLELYGHVGSFERIVANLIDNAYKYTDVGGTITLAVTPDCFQITDTGEGIAPNQLEDIWKVFRQADRSRGQDGGFGLGLPLVKRLVEMQGWTIDVISELGKGSVFTIRR